MKANEKSYLNEDNKSEITEAFNSYLYNLNEMRLTGYEAFSPNTTQSYQNTSESTQLKVSVEEEIELRQTQHGTRSDQTTS